MNTREIITLQFGNYSNYVGSHWWNLQEFIFDYNPQSEPSDINHGVLYREGKTNLGHPTFTPRLLLADTNGTLKHMPETGGLYTDFQKETIPEFNKKSPTESKFEKLKKDIIWDEKKVDVVESEKQQQPEFLSDLEKAEEIEDKEYNFKDTICTWTDFLYTKLHPRSTHILKNFNFQTEKDIIDTFSNGANIWMTKLFQDDFADNIRKYIEECNNCQGFQVLFDGSNGFSGIAGKCLEYLKDEYGKAIFAVPIYSPKSVMFENADEKTSYAIELANISSAYSNLIEYSDLFVPLSTQDRIWKRPSKGREFEYLRYDSANLYETSAILASYLDTISLRYRFSNQTYSTHLFQFCSDMNNYGRKLAAAAISLPFPMQFDHDLIDTLNQMENPVFTQLSPNCKIGTDYVVQSVCVRGIPKNRLKKPSHLAQDQMQMAAYRCDSTSEMFQLYFQCSNHASLAHVSAIELPIKIRKPYPEHIFDQHLTMNGFLNEIPRRNEEHLKSVPCVAAIQNSGDIANTLETLHREASRIKISKIHRFKETGMNSDDYKEVLESLLQFKDVYDDVMDL